MTAGFYRSSVSANESFPRRRNFLTGRHHIEHMNVYYWSNLQCCCHQSAAGQVPVTIGIYHVPYHAVHFEARWESFSKGAEAQCIRGIEKVHVLL